MKQDLTGALLAEAMRAGLPGLAAAAGATRDGVLLQALMANIPDAIYFKDTASRFICINQALARRFRLSDPALAIGKTDADFFSAAHAQKALADEQRVLLTGQPLVGIEEMETWPDGSTTWVSTTKMPLRDAAGQVVGTFGISRDITEHKHAELALAERTRQLQQKNQQMEEELKMARELQLAMLPRQFPCVPENKPQPALDFFTFYSPSGAVSGDFFDIIKLPEETVGVFICDVMGHDVRAALVAAMMRTLVQDLSGAAVQPGELLAQMNRGLVGVFQQTGATMYATAFYAVLDVAGGSVLFSSAAHPAPLHVSRRHGRVERLEGTGAERKGPALGLFENSRFPTCRRRLDKGDLLALFTDGLFEAQSPAGHPFSEDGLVASVSRNLHLPVNEMLGNVIAEVRQFSGHGEFEDDVCLLGVELGTGTCSDRNRP